MPIMCKHVTLPVGIYTTQGYSVVDLLKNCKYLVVKIKTHDNYLDVYYVRKINLNFLF